MKSKLWKVTVKFEFVVAAKDEESAIRNAIADKLVGPSKEEPVYAADSLESLDDLPDGYDGESIPWGDDVEDAPIREILEGQHEEAGD